jgi:hypothetical protein
MGPFLGLVHGVDLAGDRRDIVACIRFASDVEVVVLVLRVSLGEGLRGIIQEC